MSVASSLRDIPSSEFAYRAMVLTDELTSYAISLPKRLQRHIAGPISDDCHTILKHILTADKIYITCWDELRERRYHLNRSLGALHDLEVSLLRSYLALEKSYRSERSAEEIERDARAIEAMEDYFEGPYLPEDLGSEERVREVQPNPRRRKRSRKPNPHYYELRAKDIEKVRKLVKGVKSSDPDKLRKRDRQRAERKREKREERAAKGPDQGRLFNV